MLLFEDAGGECLHGITVEHGHDGLANDWPGIDAFIHHVNGAARKLYTCLERLLLGVYPREGW